MSEKFSSAPQSPQIPHQSLQSPQISHHGLQSPQHTHQYSSSSLTLSSSFSNFQNLLQQFQQNPGSPSQSQGAQSNVNLAEEEIKKTIQQTYQVNLAFEI